MPQRIFVRFFLLSALLSCAVKPLDAQSHFREQRSDGDRREGEFLHAEVVVLPSDSAGKTALDLYVWIQYPFIMFTRTDKLSADSAFAGTLSLLATLKPRVKERTLSQSVRMQIFCREDETTQNSRGCTTSRFRFLVAPGQYDVELNISDESSKQERRILLSANAVDFSKKSALGAIIPIQTPQKTASLIALSTGADFHYGSPGWCAIPAVADTITQWSFLCITHDARRKEMFSMDAAPSFVADSFSVRHTESNSSKINLTTGSKRTRFFIFQLPMDSLDLGLYDLTAIALSPSGRDTTHLETRIVWPEMPRILLHIDDAIQAMRYILTDAEFEDMKLGDEDAQRMKFRNYWMLRDYQPGVSWIARMSEYFKRADEARLRFQTVYLHNGIFTDRGKIYMLYGAPDNIQRVLDPDQPAKEVWMYDSLKKTFRFNDKNHDGNLKLVQEK